MEKRKAGRGSRYKIAYQVKSGDSFSEIAHRYQVSTKELARWNGLKSDELLQTGKTLVIWKQAASGQKIRSIVYRIKEGDSLSLIAQRYSVQVKDIMRWNSLSQKHLIIPGQKLTLHVDVTKA